MNWACIEWISFYRWMTQQISGSWKRESVWNLSFQRYVYNGKFNSFLLVASPILVVPLNVSEVFITSGLTCWQGRRIHIWRLKSLRHPLVHRGMCIWFSEPVKKLIFFSGQVAAQTLTTRDVCAATERLTKVVFLQWKPWFSWPLEACDTEISISGGSSGDSLHNRTEFSFYVSEKIYHIYVLYRI